MFKSEGFQVLLTIIGEGTTLLQNVGNQSPDKLVLIPKNWDSWLSFCKNLKSCTIYLAL